MYKQPKKMSLTSVGLGISNKFFTQKLLMQIAAVISINFASLSLIFGQCPTGDIYLNTQQEVDLFPTTYPGCTDIQFNLFIRGEVRNVDSLKNITTIVGILSISSDSISSVSGFTSLNYVGGIEIYYCNSLANLDFTSLVEIGGDFDVFDNIGLVDVNGCNSILNIGNRINIRGNTGLQNISGLNALKKIGGEFKVNENSDLQNISGFSNVDTIGGQYWVYANQSLQFITGFSSLRFIGGFMGIFNDNMQNINGFNSLEQIQGTLSLDNPSVTTINGYTKLKSIGGEMSIFGASLVEILGMDSLKNIGSYCNIKYCDNLENASGLSKLEAIGSYLEIWGTGLTDLSAFSSLHSINGSLLIYNNMQLVDITALANLEEVHGHLSIIDNVNLTSISGLENVDTTFITDLFIIGNSDLSWCSTKSICDYLKNPSNSATIDANIVGCNTRTQVVAGCAALPIEQLVLHGVLQNNLVNLSWKTISGANVDHFIVKKSRDGNTFLELASLSQPSKSGTIYQNNYHDATPLRGTSYYKVDAVMENGSTYSSNTIAISTTTSIEKVYPNPSKGMLFFDIADDGSSPIVKVSNCFGSIIYESSLIGNSLDLSFLPSGSYFIQIFTENQSRMVQVTLIPN